MKTNIEITKFRLPVLRAHVSIVVTNNIRNAIDFVEDKISSKIHDPDTKKFTKAYMYAYEDEKNRRKYMLFLRPNSKAGEVAHEVKHLINVAFQWCGVKLSTSNDEMECYYLEDIVDRTHNAILKYRKKYSKVKKVSKILDNTEETIIFTP